MPARDEMEVVVELPVLADDHGGREAVIAERREARDIDDRQPGVEWRAGIRAGNADFIRHVAPVIERQLLQVQSRETELGLIDLV